ncbi:hypothetical protein SERLA73DRAFT_179485 [Serpula lacrymans var. lacrymans S7.3]|uniref:Alpha/beta hydrolase fold-3 domain-containing protein n=2 Tax=Serpula lacrymans var. lacrymans TaxID=341189 RepID=F8PSJ2_SERL3|nr:uncharacterized protein SERLADRAFT_464642 [Serpula lacrymans var. lacrymans S7.9]EGO01322.1 hypothetical protein SERLA73DRAFT_179485 [Serpula lacrymans var. lacrymans S7.3]EGO26960.1 hypothetical protein SERLADRAFT_464642 [Serpula lacrymans var. lacrymans S7.9]
MTHEWRRQPFRALYLGYQLLFIVFLFIPYHVVKYAPRAWRPRKSWSLQRSVGIAFVRYLGKVEEKVGSMLSFPTHEAIKEGPGVKALWINPVPELMNKQLQQWAAISGVQPIRIPGYWMDKQGLDFTIGAPLQSGEKILYRLHGGAYTLLSSHPDDRSAKYARDLLNKCSSFRRAFSVEYRLSVGPPYPARNPFPAALLDAIAGYAYLVNECKYNPSDIVIAGESAGANLALALTRYLLECQGDSKDNVFEPPAGLILLSAWVDLSTSHVKPGLSPFLNAESDYVSQLTPLDCYSKIAFLGPHGREGAETNEYISPASLHIDSTFYRFPRTILIAGGSEMFLDQIKTLKSRMVRDMGEGNGAGQVTYLEMPDSIHSFISWPKYEPQCTDALLKIAEWADVF